jgi:hypothetical protein
MSFKAPLFLWGKLGNKRYRPMKGQQSADNTVRGPQCLLNTSRELSAQQMNVFKGMGCSLVRKTPYIEGDPSYKIGCTADWQKCTDLSVQSTESIFGVNGRPKRINEGETIKIISFLFKSSF